MIFLNADCRRLIIDLKKRVGVAALLNHTVNFWDYFYNMRVCNSTLEDISK